MIKTMFAIKESDASLLEFIETLHVYRIKYCSHYGVLIYDPLNDNVIRYDNSFYSFNSFIDAIKVYAKSNSIIFAHLSLLTSKPNIGFNDAQRTVLWEEGKTYFVQNLFNKSLKNPIIAINNPIIYNGASLSLIEFYKSLSEKEIKK